MIKTYALEGKHQLTSRANLNKIGKAAKYMHAPCSKLSRYYKYFSWIKLGGEGALKFSININCECLKQHFTVHEFK